MCPESKTRDSPKWFFASIVCMYIRVSRYASKTCYQHFIAVNLICNMSMFCGILIFGFIRERANFISPARPLFLDPKTSFKFHRVINWPSNPWQHGQKWSRPNVYIYFLYKFSVNLSFKSKAMNVLFVFKKNIIHLHKWTQKSFQCI